MRVALLFGGQSGEHEVSIVSARSIANALDPDKYDVTLVGIDKKGRWLVPEQSKVLIQTNDLRALRLSQESNEIVLAPSPTRTQWMTETGKLNKFDVVFPVLHGPKGEDGTVQGLLELLGVPYVGCGVLSSAVVMDKDVSKRLLKQAGLPVVEFLSFKKSDFQSNPKEKIDQIEKTFSYPVFVKPANMGSSVGVEKIKNRAEAETKIKKAFLYDQKIIVERAIVGRELECAVLGNDKPKASCIGEVKPNHEFYSYESKYVDANGAELTIPAKNLDPSIVKQMQEISVKAFQVLECQGLSRVDFFLENETNKIYINELNTLPGFTSISQYPKLWEASGLSYRELLNELIKLAFENHQKKQDNKISYYEDD